jgi:Flp pilus assembly protein protease CpaA
MFDVFLLAGITIAFVGSLVAGLWDLRTTDIPDEITALMAILGVVVWFLYGAMTGIFTPFLFSLVFGSLVFAFGWLLYLSGKWGGGDAVLFAAVFYLIPDVLFMISYVVNLLVVSIVYSVVYAFVLGAKYPKVFGNTLVRLKSKFVWIPLLAWLVCGIPIVAFFPVSAVLMWFVIMLSGLFLVYGHEVEKSVFRKTIPSADLRPGMVLGSSRKWVGASTEEVETIKKSLKHAEVKDGVRFGLVFFLALAVSILFGNVLFLTMGM